MSKPQSTVRSYEIMVILPPTLSSDKQTETLNQVKELITARGGEIVHEDFWGKREFCYPIKKQIDGYYTVLNFNLPTAKFSDLNKYLRLNTSLLRFLTTKIPINHKITVFERDKAYLGLDRVLMASAAIDLGAPPARKDVKEKIAELSAREEKLVKVTKPPVQRKEIKLETPTIEKPVKETDKSEIPPATPVDETVKPQTKKETSKLKLENQDDKLEAIGRQIDELLSRDDM